ncbi:MAG: hypothetical protein JWP10_1254 [Nocardioidaceae bacterium]|nr:hypothetical protein [Nocardioidaceae bacterium]
MAMCVAGLCATVVAGVLGSWSYAAVVGWALASLVYTAWVWIVIGRLDAADTKNHAVREDPSRGMSDLLVLVASLASLAAVAVVLIEARDASGAKAGVLAALAVTSVALSWLLIHTVFTLRYARLYYRDTPGGIDFNQDEPPQYTDFAYLAFSLGMTFQVSDTNIENHDIRATALRHALLSYVFGSVILATTINLVVGLSN